MGCPSRMDLLDQGNTFGPLQLDFQRLVDLVLPTLNVHVRIERYERMSHPSWETTSFVRVGTRGGSPGYCIRVTHCGMVRAVHPLPAVRWATHLEWLPPGFVSNCLKPQLMTSKFASAVDLTRLKILQSNVLNSTSSDRWTLSNQYSATMHELAYCAH